MQEVNGMKIYDFKDMEKIFRENLKKRMETRDYDNER